MVTLISHFYNEEYLLPWWLEQNKKMFEHGILYNYFSTDRSVEIIKKICPTWEIRDTKNKNWEVSSNDAEIVLGERDVDGYKMFLTMTEFLVGKFPDLLDEPTCFTVPMFRLVDNNPEDIPTYDKPLFEQKTFGYWANINRYRFLHNHYDGGYVGLSKHKTKYKTSKCSTLKIYKCVFSPWTEEYIQRRINMSTNRDPNDKGGCHHWWGRERLEEERKKELKKSYEFNERIKV